MPRPPKPIIRSVLESRNAETTENAKDLENTKLKASEATLSKNRRRINDDKQFFKLVLPPDLMKDLENSSEETSLKRNPNRSTKINSVIGSSAIEILSSSSEEDLFNHSSSTKEVGRSSPTKTLSSVEDNKKSLLEGNNGSLANSNKLPQGQNLSTPKSHFFSINQKPKKEIEMNSEDNDSDDPFGFGKAEKMFMKRKGQNQSDKISDDSKKFEVTTIGKDSQYNDIVQSKMLCKSISLYKETNKIDTNGSGGLFGIDKQDWTQRKQESKECENEKDDNYQIDNDNNQPIHDGDHFSTEIDKESLGMTPIKTPRDKNKKEEKKMPNATPSRVRKTPNITKTADLVSLLPSRRQLERASKNKIDNYCEIQEEVVSFDEEKRWSDYEGKTPKKRKVGKMQNEKSEKRKPRKTKKETFILESEEDEKTQEERAERIRRTEEIDSFVLVEEVVD